MTIELPLAPTQKEWKSLTSILFEQVDVDTPRTCLNGHTAVFFRRVRVFLVHHGPARLGPSGRFKKAV